MDVCPKIWKTLELFTCTRARVTRLNTHLLDEIMPESQCGFRKNRCTVDMIFCARQIQEKCKEQNQMVQQSKNVKVLQKAKTQSIDTLLTLSQLRWSGHLLPMSDDRLPKQLFYSELSEGHRLRGKPSLRFKDTLKKSLQNCRIATSHWETTASNRRVWKQLTRKGAAAYEQAKRRAHAEKRAATNAGTESRESSIPCHVCSRICASEFGLRSHLRVHRWTPDLGARLDIIAYDSRPYIYRIIRKKSVLEWDQSSTLVKVDYILESGKNVDNPCAIANIFNNFFVNVGKNSDKDILWGNCCPTSFLEGIFFDSMFLSPILLQLKLIHTYLK